MTCPNHCGGWPTACGPSTHTNDYDYAVPDEEIDAERAEQRARFTSIKYRTVHPVVRVHPPPLLDFARSGGTPIR